MLNASRLAVIVASSVLVAHATWIDRLNVTKLAVGAVATTLAVVLLLARKRMPSVGPLWALAAGLLLLAWVAFPEFVSTRIEGWPPLIVAAALFTLAATNEDDRAGVILAWVAGGLAALGILQAVGLEFFTGEVHVFANQRVMGTLGNPSLYGICTALLLPFCVARAKSNVYVAISGLVVAALVLSGARTAWVMALPSVWVAVKLVPWRRSAVVALLGMVLGAGVGASTSEVDLSDRVADLGSSGGTAAGRLYLWRVNLSLVAEAGPFGSGPGAYQRNWPQAQGAYLANHPEDAHFFSDIRHAHADPVEVAVDWGWLGLFACAFGAVRLLRVKGPGGSSHTLTAARGAVIAAVIGGLASSVLFQPPSLFVSAVAAGLIWSHRRTDEQSNRRRPYWSAAVLVVLVLTCTLFARHVQSEFMRTEGLKARVSGNAQAAVERSCGAVQAQPENPLALAMCALELVEDDPQQALEHAEHAAQLLPTADVYALISIAAQEAGDAEQAGRSMAQSNWLRGN